MWFYLSVFEYKIMTVDLWSLLYYLSILVCVTHCLTLFFFFLLLVWRLKCLLLEEFALKNKRNNRFMSSQFILESVIGALLKNLWIFSDSYLLLTLSVFCSALYMLFVNKSKFFVIPSVSMRLRPKRFVFY